MEEHKGKIIPKSFSCRYNIDHLVHLEEYSTCLEAKEREQQLKAGPRWRKEKLINKNNPNWKDLSEYID
jgi:putative endonuclease